jgi:hypothetical protein
MKNVTAKFKTTCLLLFGAMTLSVGIQARENLFANSFEQAGYGGPELIITQLNGSNGLIIGGKGAGIWGNDIYAFSTGIGAYMTAGRLALDATRDFSLAYVGATAGYSKDPSSMIHFTSDAFLGLGQAWSTDRTTSDRLETGNVLVLSVGVSAEINLTEHFQVGVGGGWRAVSNPDIAGLSGSQLSGPSATLSFKFGNFD